MQTRIPVLLCTVFILQLTSCSDVSSEKPAAASSENQEIVGVSVWDRISTRDQPVRSSPRTTLLSLGERFTYLDTFAIDSTNDNTKFLRVRLSDSTIVWVYDFASVLNAKPAVIRNEVPLYLRPDLLTITADKLNAMDIVAVVEVWDNWIKVVNEKKEHTGWIKKDFITYDSIDLAFALLAKRYLEEEDPEQRIENLEGLLENNPYPQTIFLPEIRNRLDEEMELLRESEYEWEQENRNRRERDR